MLEMTTLSTKYMVEIPPDIRKQMDVKPGQTFWVLFEKGSIKLIPKKNLKDLRGLLKGMNTDIEREDYEQL